MTMTINAIAAVSPAGVAGVSGVSPAGGLDSAVAIARTGVTAGGSDFATVLGGAVDQLQGLQNTSQSLAIRAMTGDLENVHDYTIAAAEASTALQLAAAVRDRAVTAFQEIMRMQA
jgi:flagellar hook-basal body complex protein FliE